MRKLANVVFLSSALWVVSATAQVREEFSVPVDYQGSQIQLRPELQKPTTGAGPSPVVIALHACSGPHDPSSMGAWLGLFRQQGYATLQLDSFTARGYENVCSNPGEVTGVERAQTRSPDGRISDATALRSLVAWRLGCGSCDKGWPR